MEKKIVYTESGKKAIDEYLEKQKKRLEEKIYDKKYVMGDEEIEITAYDIKSCIEHGSDFRRIREKIINSQLFPKIYIALGLITAFFGVMYPMLIRMLEFSTSQFMLTVMGISISLIGIIWSIILKIKNSNK